MSEPTGAPPPPRLRLRALTVAVLVAVVACAGWLVTARRLADATSDAATTPTPSARPSAGDFLSGLREAFRGEADLGACAQPDAPGERGLPADPAAAIDVIAERVADRRGLAFPGRVATELLDADALRERVTGLVDADYTAAEAAVDERVLVALGAAPDDIDLLAVTRDLLGEQVAGFYEPDSQRLVAIDSGDLDALTSVTLAHELDHALTDAVLGLPDLDALGDADADAALAAQALVEGDATLLMQQYTVAHLGLDEVLGLAQLDVEQSALEAAPHLLQEQLEFPYIEGLRFVCAVYQRDGWAGIDALYADPPISTAQVLFPDRYLAHDLGSRAADVVTPDGWTVLRDTTLGAADLLWLFTAPGDDPSAALLHPRDHAAAWDGGRLAAFGRDDDTIVALSLVDRGVDGDLCDSMRAWYEAAFPDDDDMTTDGGRVTYASSSHAGAVTCEDRQVLVAIGGDPASVQAVATS